MPPALAMAFWLGTLSVVISEMADRTRTVRSATRLPSNPTSRLAIAMRLSVFLADKLASAIPADSIDLSSVPPTSSPTRGSIPPSLAIVALLAALFVANAHKAHAERSLVSGLPSRTLAQRGAMAPVLATAA